MWKLKGVPQNVLLHCTFGAEGATESGESSLERLITVMAQNLPTNAFSALQIHVHLHQLLAASRRPSVTGIQ